MFHVKQYKGGKIMEGDVLSACIIGTLIALIMYYLDKKHKD